MRKMRFSQPLAYLAITIIGALLLANNTANCDDHKMAMTLTYQEYTYMGRVLAMMTTTINMHREYGELGVKTVAKKLDSGVDRDQIEEKFLTIVPEQMHAPMRKAFKTVAELATLVEPNLNFFEKEVLRLKLAANGRPVKVNGKEKKMATKLLEFAQEFMEILAATEGIANGLMEIITENMNRYIFERDPDLQIKNRNKNDAALLCYRISTELNDLIEGAKKMRIIKLRVPEEMSGLADKLASVYELVKSMIATMPKKIREAKRGVPMQILRYRNEAKKLIVQYRQLLIWQQFLSAAFQFGKRLRDLLTLFSENMLTMAIMDYAGNPAPGLIVKLVEVKEKRLNTFLDGTYLQWSSRLAQLSVQERWEGGKPGEEMDKNVTVENLQSKLEPAFALLLWLYRQLDMRADCLDLYERFGEKSQQQSNDSDDEETSASKQSRIRQKIGQAPLDVPDEAQLMEKFLKSDDSREERKSGSRRRDKSSEQRHRERRKSGGGERSVSVTRTEEPRVRRNGEEKASGSHAARNSRGRRRKSGNKEQRYRSPEKHRKKERPPAAESSRRDNANDEGYRKSRAEREGRRRHGSSSGGRYKSGSRRPESSGRAKSVSSRKSGGSTRGDNKHETRHRNSRSKQGSNNKREEEHGNRRRSADGGGKRRSHHNRKH